MKSFANGASPIDNSLGYVTDGFLEVRGKDIKGLLGIALNGGTICIGYYSK
jgi:hypothetical protein